MLTNLVRNFLLQFKEVGESASETFTGGYPYYYPVELFYIRIGSLTALLGLVAALLGKGDLRLTVAAISTLNLLVWFADAMAQ